MAEKKKAMISQPMSGLTTEEIKRTKEKALKCLEEKGYEVLNTLFDDEWKNGQPSDVNSVQIHFLAKALGVMSKCSAVYFCKGWEQSNGCRIEHATAESYGLEMVYEE